MAPERPGSEDERCGGAPAGQTLLHANVPAGRQPLVINGDLLKEGDGAAKMFTEVKVGSATTEDDDLRPLSWLQDRDLLKGIALRAGPMCPEGSGGEARSRRLIEQEINHPVSSQQRRAGSPTSDYAEDSSDRPDSRSSSGAPSSPCPSAPPPESFEPPPTQQHSNNSSAAQSNIIPYNPQIHITTKPPYSFSCLIFMAIEDCPTRALPVKDIYAWILDHFPYFQGAPTGWKNSVRHNLSLNKCFKKVDKSPNVGKGSLWMVDPTYRPNLLQALRKAPFHPLMRVERYEANPPPVANSALPVSSPPANGKYSSSGSSSSSNSSVGEYSIPVVLATTPSPPSTPGRSNLPNPNLFPFLSRRLAAAGLGLSSNSGNPQTLGDAEEEEDEDSDSREDVDAAAAMLALKHGPRVLLPRREEWYKRLRENSAAPDDGEKAGKRARLIQEMGQAYIFTTSPSEDHTYSAGPTGTSPPNGSSRPALSPDEAFGEGSASSAESSHGKGGGQSDGEEEEQRKIAEGADALLNLAGICTSGSRGVTSGNTKRTISSPGMVYAGRHSNKRQRLFPDPPPVVPTMLEPPLRLWKKASLHQGSRAHKNRSKEKAARNRR